MFYLILPSWKELIRLRMDLLSLVSCPPTITWGAGSYLFALSWSTKEKVVLE